MVSIKNTYCDWREVREQTEQLHSCLWRWKLAIGKRRKTCAVTEKFYIQMEAWLHRGTELSGCTLKGCAVNCLWILLQLKIVGRYCFMIVLLISPIHIFMVLACEGGKCIICFSSSLKGEIDTNFCFIFNIMMRKKEEEKMRKKKRNRKVGLS